MAKQERFIAEESRKHPGTFVVIDTKTVVIVSYKPTRAEAEVIAAQRNEAAKREGC